MRRFFVQPDFLLSSSGTLTDELFRHISTVLRLKPGETITLADGCGSEAVATIIALEKHGAVVNISPPRKVSTEEGQLAVTLCQALPKGEKMDMILQKATELGVTRIIGFSAERSVARLDSDKAEKRVSRWEKIVQEAARQSGRSSIPSVAFAPGITDFINTFDSDLKLLLWEDEKNQGLREILEREEAPGSVSIVIGPEGGLTPKEAATFMAAGYTSVTLGNRILRTETAGLAALSILQYLWGDLGNPAGTI